MRNKTLELLRNKKIKERYTELQSTCKNRHKIFKMMELEFWLTSKSLIDIVYLKRKQQNNLFNNERT